MSSISGVKDPIIRQISSADVAESLGKGLRDFQAAPFIGLTFGALYALGGIVIVISVTHLGLSYLAYPLAAGFALIGPFVAVGLYEVSRRREAGEPVELTSVLRKVRSRSEVGWMAFVTVFIFMIWMYQVRLLMALFLGINASYATLGQFITHVITTQEGLLFLAVGNVIGAILSLVLFSLTAVSFPLLLDREVDAVTAMVTSVRSVILNPVVMISWAGIVVLLLIFSVAAAFLGLVVTLPVLGHATWHLYRRVVEPA